MLVDFLAALLIAVLTGLGIGSGGLLVIYLTLIDNVPQIAAQGQNLLFFVFSAGASMFIHLLKRNVYFTVVLLLIASAIPGVFLGVFLADTLSVDVVRTVFGVMLVASGCLVFFRKSGEKDRKARKKLLYINKK